MINQKNKNPPLWIIIQGKNHRLPTHNEIYLLPGTNILVLKQLCNPWQRSSIAAIREKSQQMGPFGCSSLVGIPDKARAPICLKLFSFPPFMA